MDLDWELSQQGPDHSASSSENTSSESALRPRASTVRGQAPRTRPSGGPGHLRQNAVAGPDALGTPMTAEHLRVLGRAEAATGREQARHEMRRQRQSHFPETIAEVPNNDENSYLEFIRNHDRVLAMHAEQTDLGEFIEDTEHQDAGQRSAFVDIQNGGLASAVLDPALDTYNQGEETGSGEGAQDDSLSDYGTHRLSAASRGSSPFSWMEPERLYFLPSNLLSSSDGEDTDDDDGNPQTARMLASSPTPWLGATLGTTGEEPVGNNRRASVAFPAGNPLQAQLSRHPWGLPTTAEAASMGMLPAASAPAPAHQRQAPPRPTRDPNPELPPPEVLEAMLDHQVQHSQLQRQSQQQGSAAAPASMTGATLDWPLPVGDTMRRASERHSETVLSPLASYMAGRGFSQSTEAQFDQPILDGYAQVRAMPHIQQPETTASQDVSALLPTTSFEGLHEYPQDEHLSAAHPPPALQEYEHLDNATYVGEYLTTDGDLGWGMMPPTPPLSIYGDFLPLTDLPIPESPLHATVGASTPAPVQHDDSDLFVGVAVGDSSGPANPGSIHTMGRHPSVTITAATTTSAMTHATATAAMTRAETMASSQDYGPLADAIMSGRASGSNTLRRQRPMTMPPRSSYFSEASSSASSSSEESVPWMAGHPALVAGQSSFAAGPSAAMAGSTASTAGPATTMAPSIAAPAVTVAETTPLIAAPAVTVTGPTPSLRRTTNLANLGGRDNSNGSQNSAHSTSANSPGSGNESWVSAATSAPIPIPGASGASGSGPSTGAANVPPGPQQQPAPVVDEDEEIAQSINMDWRAYLRERQLLYAPETIGADDEFSEEFLRPLQESRRNAFPYPPRGYGR